MKQPETYKPKHKVRIVTAASLFDGHDAAINIMRRIIQSTGVEVIHLGHDRSVDEVVNCAIQEDANAIAMTSYQGGHNEYFKYMYDLLQEKSEIFRPTLKAPVGLTRARYRAPCAALLGSGEPGLQGGGRRRSQRRRARGFRQRLTPCVAQPDAGWGGRDACAPARPGFCAGPAGCCRSGGCFPALAHLKLPGWPAMIRARPADLKACARTCGPTGSRNSTCDSGTGMPSTSCGPPAMNSAITTPSWHPGS